MCNESIVPKSPCSWSRYDMLGNYRLSKSFNGLITERRTADTDNAMAWHEWRTGEGGLVNSHTSTDYVLEGAEPSASSDSWAGNRVCRGTRGLTPLGNTNGSRADLCGPPASLLPQWPAVCAGRWTGPVLLLDEHSLMAASLKAVGPIWGGVSFTSLQLGLAEHSSGCPALLSCPHDGPPRGWNVCHLFYFQIKVDDLPIKKWK